MGLAKAAIAVCDKSTAVAPTAGAVLESCRAEAGVNYLTDMRVSRILYLYLEWANQAAFKRSNSFAGRGIFQRCL